MPCSLRPVQLVKGARNSMKKGYLRYGSACFVIACLSILLLSCGSGGGGGSSGASTGTASITLSTGQESIPADGVSSTAITATLKNSSGTGVPQGTSASFSTTLGTFVGGVTTFSITTPDDSGIVTVSLISGTTSGVGIVRATSNSVTQAVAIVFTASGGGTPGDPASIEVYSVQRVSVSVKGSGQPETSNITFVVKDLSGLEVADGNIINFSITGGGVGGGESLSNSSDTTLGGYVDTTLQSGTRAGVVKIKAELASDPSVSTDVSITIAGGPPYGEHLGLNPQTLNIAGLVFAGLEDTLTMRVTDKYFNNVPDGTSVWFTTDYGGVTGAGVTQSDPGVAVSFADDILTTMTPYPPDGVVTPATFTQSGAYARVLCLAINSANNDIIYLGTDGGGIFKTTDGGTNWTQVGIPEKGLTNGIVWDIEIDPENSAIVYAATDGGVYRSIGSGDEWEKLSRAKEITGESLGTLDTTDADNDGYSDQAYTLTYSRNMIRSKTHVYLDSVVTYQYIYTSANSLRFIVKDLGAGGEAITIDYTTPIMIPAAYPVRALALPTNVTGAPTTDRTLYAGTYGSGVYQSTDSGFSWSAKNSGLSDQDVLSLAIDPNTNSTLFAGTQGGGVFKTTDGASTWAASNSGLPASVIHAIIIDPNTTSRLYVGTEQDGVYYSTNNGATWTAPTTNVTSPRVTKIVLDSTANPAAEIYAATYGDGTDPLGGVYKSSDSGATWARLTALGENHVHALGIIGAATDTLFAGTWGRNLFKSTDSGTTWNASNGSAPDELTNQIFATTQVLFSGYTTTAPAVLVQTETSWQGAGGDDYLNDGAKRLCIYHNGSANFIFTVQDANGNPLVGGTTISASVDQGTLSGNTSVTLADTQASDLYALTWTDNITGDQNLAGSLTITVTSENGNVNASITRTLIRPVAVSISPSAPAFGDTVIVTPTGGSETVDITSTTNARGGYTITHPGGIVACSYGSSVQHTAGVKDSNETVTVWDDITGEYEEISYTVK